MHAFRARIVLRNRALIFAQDIDAEALLGVQMRVGACAVIDADQNQHGIERNRGKGIRRHPVDLAVEVDGNDCDPGGERSHRLAEFLADMIVETLIVEKLLATSSSPPYRMGPAET